MTLPQAKPVRARGRVRGLIARDFKLNWLGYLMALPPIVYFLIFHYAPMYGILISFTNYAPAKGLFGSTWVGLKNFQDFFSSFYFGRLMRNTFLLGLYDILWAFPASIIFALLLNELKFPRYKKAVQTITYMPYFISMMVVASLILEFASPTGLAGVLFNMVGETPRNMLGDSRYFRSIYVITNIWQYMGFNSIIFLAALAGIDQELYEAAMIDGAGRMRRMWHITLPGIAPTITILLILRLGSTLNVGFEKIFLIYNPGIYETADVISTFVYRKGLMDVQYGYSTAVGLFNSLINFTILFGANFLSGRISETSLW